MIAVDLFAGCGGLTQGLKQSGFEVTVGVEIEGRSASTYAVNHPEIRLIQEDIRNVTPEVILEKLGKKLPNLVAGCAPCQGFTSLTRKYGDQDPRNLLLLEMARLIEALSPDAVLMENVPGIATRGTKILEQFVAVLKRAGYYTNHAVVQMADYGLPQLRRRLVLTAGKGFVIPFPKATHARKPEPNSGRVPWETLRSAVGKMGQPVTLKQSRSAGGPQHYEWHVVRDLQAQTRVRLDAAIPGKTWLHTHEGIRPKCHQGGYKGFTNVYGRMEWDQPSVTITGGCTTACKGRFGHPEPSRTTISVREAALLQSFPIDYKFPCDYMDPVCDMIGNAVPPKYAEIIGIQILKSLASHNAALARKT